MKFNLVENALDSLKEAIAHYEKGNQEEEAREYKFCILLLNHCIELLLKEILFKTHPVLVAEDIDNYRQHDRSQHTIGFKKSLARIKHICNINLGSLETHINEISEYRNKVQHSDFEISKIQIDQKLAKGFYIVNYIFLDLLKLDYSDYSHVIDEEWYSELGKLEDALNAAKAMALKKVGETGIERYYFEYYSNSNIKLRCPLCGQEYLYKHDDGIKCAFCHVEYEDYENMSDVDRDSDSYMYDDLLRKLGRRNVDLFDCPDCFEECMIYDAQHDEFVCINCVDICETAECDSCGLVIPANEPNCFEWTNNELLNPVTYTICASCAEDEQDRYETDRLYMEGY